ncbi:hypothetical protein BJP36_06025 [Moorena producens JHB]|uniref:Uncharacterized protein n=1 Tax=Moorena producens (strain JHB) TaxID=1454205 RepID=A0A1D9FVY0_MOOP1|nr:hypothetical protein [Moorena producens]AOY79538.1 hypothetical protein BJP36_06025 [Moorena producens JHB]
MKQPCLNKGGMESGIGNRESGVMTTEFDNAFPDGRKHVNAMAIRNDSFFIIIKGTADLGTGNRE